MIVAGQMPPVNGLGALLNNLAADPSLVALTETTSNLKVGNFVSHIDNVLSAIEDEADYVPDLLITLGGQIVSKNIKKFLRRNKPQAHCHFSRSGEHTDSFQSLTDIIPRDPVRFFICVKDVLLPGESDYGNKWKQLDLITRQRHNIFLEKCEFTDLKAFEIIINYLPDHSLLHLSNSTPIRYSQLFTCDKDINFMSNRGTSGMDGCVSTAAGTAYVTDKITTIITGDLAFFYDSNAIWHKPCLITSGSLSSTTSGAEFSGFLTDRRPCPSWKHILKQGTTTGRQRLLRHTGWIVLLPQMRKLLPRD